MSRAVVRVAALFLPMIALAQCAPPPPPTGQARADAATLAACREHADAAYTRTHRDTIYTITNRDAPFSGGYMGGVVDRGLAQRYGHENMIRDCVRNTGTETDRSAATAPQPGAPLPGNPGSSAPTSTANTPAATTPVSAKP
ncbi:MAG: hypothetical protein WDN25_25945 [Acetobacteraceae bacterium]